MQLWLRGWRVGSLLIREHRLLQLHAERFRHLQIRHDVRAAVTRSGRKRNSLLNHRLVP